MFTPKYFILFVAIFVIQSFVFAQKKEENGSGKKWQAGISLGNASIKGEVPALFPQPGWGIFARRPVKKWIAFQFQYTGGITRGLNTSPAYNYGKNEAWSTKYNAPVLVQEPNGPERLKNSVDGTPYTSTSGDPVFYNYRTVFHQLALQARFSYAIETIKPRIGFYGVIGIGGLFYHTKVDALDKNGSTYVTLFKDITNANQNGGMSKQAVRKKLNEEMDRVYETKAEQDEKNKSFTNTFQTGAGVTVYLNNKFQIELEHVVSFTKQTLLDGQQWNETPFGDARIARYFDRIGYTAVTLCYNF